MAMQLQDIGVRAALPEIPADLPVFVVRAPSLEERRPAIERFRALLNLDKLKTVDEDDSVFFENADGGVQFYRASGSLWAENGRADDAYPDERRPWPVVTRPDVDNPKNSRLVLPDQEEKRLAQRARELFQEAGLLAPEAFFADVKLDQVAKLDEQGKEIERGVGLANVRFLYRLNALGVDGPGAKTYAFFNPGPNAPVFASAYHAWRPVQDKRKVRMASIHEILERTVLRDPEMQLRHQRGDKIELRKIDLIYWALRPDADQRYVPPALRVEGVVFFKESTQGREGLEFSRIYNAVAQKDCAAAGIYADYLVDTID